LYSSSKPFLDEKYTPSLDSIFEMMCQRQHQCRVDTKTTLIAAAIAKSWFVIKLRGSSPFIASRKAWNNQQ